MRSGAIRRTGCFGSGRTATDWSACGSTAPTTAATRSASSASTSMTNPTTRRWATTSSSRSPRPATAGCGSVRAAGGLNLFDPRSGRFARYTTSSGDRPISSNDILSLYTGRDSTLWVGTGYGLNRLCRDADGGIGFERYTEKEGLPNNTIHGILEDDAGLLWLSTNKGLARLDPVSGQVVGYYKFKALQNNEFSDGAYYRGRDGRCTSAAWTASTASIRTTSACGAMRRPCSSIRSRSGSVRSPISAPTGRSSSRTARTSSASSSLRWSISATRAASMPISSGDSTTTGSMPERTIRPCSPTCRRAPTSSRCGRPTATRSGATAWRRCASASGRRGGTRRGPM